MTQTTDNQAARGTDSPGGLGLKHATMLCQYGGISFIAGAVNHGFFSGARSLLTAAIGVALYVLGAWLQRRTEPARAAGWAELLGPGIVLSIGLGFFTGGLQHFPDSPVRSAWVVPLGFMLSGWALWRLQGGAVRTLPALRYGALASLVVALACGGALWVWPPGNALDLASDGHGHGDHALGESTTAAPPALVAAGGPTARLIDIRMDDAMRFTPSNWRAEAGETVLLRVTNAGRLPHELVLGTPAQLQAHRDAMAAAPKSQQAHAHAGNSALHLAPGATDELRYRFSQAGTIDMACFVPGHYEAGMRGRVEVVASAEAATDRPHSGVRGTPHDHSSHEHGQGAGSKRQ